MNKITRFQDIMPFVRDGSYQVNMPLERVWPWIQDHQSMGNGFSVLNLDPDFQRPHVWSKSQQKNWLEHLLRNGRSGRIIYFNHPGWMRDWKGDFVLVDGKQRLEAVRAFLNNEVKVFGSYFKDFTDKVGMGADLLLNVNTLKTRREVLAWYLQFNAGGTPHSRKEINRVIELYKQECAS